MCFLRTSISVRRASAITLLLMAICATTILQAEEMTYPVSVAVAEDGTIYIADLKLPGIWKSKEGSLEVYFQASNKFGTPLNGVRCIAIGKDGKLLAGDSATREVYRFDDAAKPQPLTNGGIGMPQGIAIDEDGSLFVSDLETHSIYKVPAEGGEARTFARVKGPLGLVRDSDKNLIVVTRQGKLVKVNGEGQVEPFGEGEYKFAQGIVSGPEKTFFVSDSYAATIHKIDADGKSMPLLTGEPLKGPVGLAYGGDRLLIADPRVPAIFSVSGDGKAEQLLPATAGK